MLRGGTRNGILCNAIIQMSTRWTFCDRKIQKVEYMLKKMLPETILHLCLGVIFLVFSCTKVDKESF